MTLRTVTYNTATHVLVPIEPTDEWVKKFESTPEFFDFAKDTLRDSIAAAPEFQYVKELNHYGWALLDGNLTLFFTRSKDDEESWKGKNFSSIPLYSYDAAPDYKENENGK